MNNLKPGDIITCRDKDDLVKTMFELGKEGILGDMDFTEEKPRIIIQKVREKKGS